jgi:hypothetical protein
MRRPWRQASLHSCYWRQHLSHWLALQIQQTPTRIIVLLPSTDDSKTTSTNHHQHHPLPGQPAHSRGPQHSLRPTSFAGNVRGYQQHPLAPDFPADAIQTQRFHSHILQLIPKGFKISPLPNKISCFLIQALQTIESSWIQSKRRPTRKRTASGADGPPSALQPDFELTISLLSYTTTNESLSSSPFSPSTAWLAGVKKEPFLASVHAPWFC